MLSQKVRVLLVDEEAVERVLFQQYVEQASLPYDCTIAENVESAERFLRDEIFDVVLLDYETTGSTAARVLDAAGSIPVIFINSSGKETPSFAVAGGVADVLSKGEDAPFTGVVPVAIELAIERHHNRERADLLSHAIEGFQDGVMIFDASGCIEYVNPAFCRILGWEQDQLIGQDCRIIDIGFIKGEEEPIDALLRVQKEGAFIAYVSKRDKSLIELEITVACIDSNPRVGSAGLLVLRNLVELRRAEKESELLQKQLAQAQRLQTLGEIAGGIIHDFNNILGSVMGYTELVMDDVKDRPRSYENLRQVIIAANRARSLVEQILRLGRPKDREPVVVSMRPLIEEVVKLVRATVPSTIDIVTLLPDEDIMVLAEPSHVCQVVLNLAINSAQAIGWRSGVITISLTSDHFDDEAAILHGLKRGHYLRLTVIDNGPGIARDPHHRIFEPFFSTKEEEKGTGLGLAAVKEIIEGCGGQVHLESEVGQGARFDVYLPRCFVDTSGEEISFESIGETPKTLHAPHRILFVDDEDGLARVSKLMLERLGCSVQIAADGARAWELFLQGPDSFDVVITDQAMPRMTGDELAKSIWSIRPAMPVVLVSGYSGHITPDKAAQLGFAAFLSKPVSFGILASTLKGLLE